MDIQTTGWHYVGLCARWPHSWSTLLNRWSWYVNAFGMVWLLACHPVNRSLHPGDHHFSFYLLGNSGAKWLYFQGPHLGKSSTQCFSLYHIFSKKKDVLSILMPARYALTPLDSYYSLVARNMHSDKVVIFQYQLCK